MISGKILALFVCSVLVAEGFVAPVQKAKSVSVGKAEGSALKGYYDGYGGGLCRVGGMDGYGYGYGSGIQRIGYGNYNHYPIQGNYREHWRETLAPTRARYGDYDRGYYPMRRHRGGYDDYGRYGRRYGDSWYGDYNRGHGDNMIRMSEGDNGWWGTLDATRPRYGGYGGYYDRGYGGYGGYGGYNRIGGYDNYRYRDNWRTPRMNYGRYRYNDYDYSGRLYHPNHPYGGYGGYGGYGRYNRGYY